jgi:hypothetical protein
MGNGVVFSGGETKEYGGEVDDLLRRVNLKIKTSDVFKDREEEDEENVDGGEEGDEEKEKDLEKEPKFKWHCEKGIIENVGMLNKEFVDKHKLDAMKVYIGGPPAIGKTHYARMMAEKYNLNLIEVSDVVFKGYEMAKRSEVEEGEEGYLKNEEEREMGTRIKEKIEEIRESMAAQI